MRSISSAYCWQCLWAVALACALVMTCLMQPVQASYALELTAAKPAKDLPTDSGSQAPARVSDHHQSLQSGNSDRYAPGDRALLPTGNLAAADKNSLPRFVHLPALAVDATVVVPVRALLRQGSRAPPALMT